MAAPANPTSTAQAAIPQTERATVFGGESGQRRPRGTNDPEAQKRREEFMRLTPEEREARMKDFRGAGRRGGQPTGSATVPENRNP